MNEEVLIIQGLMKLFPKDGFTVVDHSSNMYCRYVHAFLGRVEAYLLTGNPSANLYFDPRVDTVNLGWLPVTKFIYSCLGKEESL